jgi:hypothetical protein
MRERGQEEEGEEEEEEEEEESGQHWGKELARPTGITVTIVRYFVTVI